MEENEIMEGMTDRYGKNIPQRMKKLNEEVRELHNAIAYASTESILARNADIAVNTGTEWLFLMGDDGEIAVKAIDGGSFVAWVRTEYGAVPLRPVKYVHELQHLLWAMGLNDNLEIL